MTSLVVREFQEDLERIKARYGSRREDEWRVLYLLALEREQLVASHYSAVPLHARIDALKVPEEVRRLIHHALRWAARDEEMHTIYARGVLFRRGERALSIRAMMQQLGGLVAGWSSAVTQHVSFWRGPISRSLAWVVSRLGLAAGKVPQSARGTLSYQTFADFAAFNAEAEETAAMCWERLAALDDPNPDLCLRVAVDERKHAAVFHALIATLDDKECLRPEANATTLGEKFHDIDDVFVPRDFRRDNQPKLGTGADVFVREDRTAKPTKLLQEVLIDNGLLDQVLREQGSARVVIKINFMMSYDRRDLTTLVDPDLIAALCEQLHERGVEDIVLLDTGNLFDKYFSGRSIDEVANYMGLRFPHARLVDAAKDQVPHVFRRGLGQTTISRAWRDGQVRISLTKMRTNPSFLVHLTMANLETLGQRIDDLLFADRLADASTGLMMTLDEFPCHLAILDATHDVADGLTGTLGTSSPRHPGRIYASEDAIALDWVATKHMGLVDLPRTTSCCAALDWFGDFRAKTKVVGVDSLITPFINPHADDIRILLSMMAYPVYVYLSGGGSLWMPKMDPAAFPLLRREGAFEFVARRLLRWLFRFGVPAETKELE